MERHIRIATHAVLVFILILVIASACARDDSLEQAEQIPDEPDTADPPGEEEPTRIVRPGDTDRDVVEARLEVYEWGLEPSRIEVEQGDRVRLILASRDRQHGISIREGYRVTLIVPAGGEAATEFTASHAGEFTIRCALACGGENTYSGTLVVR